MHGFTLVSYKMIRVDYNQFDKHFCFFHYVCLCLKTNRSDLSFNVHKFINTVFAETHLICNMLYLVQKED